MAVRITEPQGPAGAVGRVEAGMVVADGLTTTAREFVARAAELDDPGEIGRLCQEAFDIGVTAWRTVQVDSELRRAVDLMGRFEESINDATSRAVESVHAEMEAIARPEGGLISTAVNREMARLSEALEAAFAQEDKNSVLSRVEQVITAATGQVVADAVGKMQRLVDPSIDESPMGRLVREITREIRPGLDDVTKRVEELSKFLEVSAAVAKEREKGTAKGRLYEDLVYDALVGMATVTGDVVERVGTEAGALGGQVGDHVVVVKGPAGPVRIVFEAKDRDVKSRREARDELDQAAENRQAAVAVMVFAGQTRVTGEMPLVRLADRRHAVVYDKNTLNDLALRVAYQQARHEALASQGAEAVINLPELANRVARARQILDQITEVKRGHGQISSGLKLAGDQLDRLQRDLGAALDAITELISRSEAAGPDDASPA